MIGRPVQLPERLWKHLTESNSSAPYLVSCLATPTILYLSPKFESITGYPCQKFITEGVS